MSFNFPPHISFNTVDAPEAQAKAFVRKSSQFASARYKVMFFTAAALGADGFGKVLTVAPFSSPRFVLGDAEALLYART